MSRLIKSLLASVESAFLYQPRSYTRGHLKLLTGIRTLTFQTEHGWQRAYYRPSLHRVRRIWVLFHGNAGLALEWNRLQSYTKSSEHTGYLLVEYPGYGYNGGKPSPTSILTNALMAMNLLANEFLDVKFGVLGYSLGCAAGLMLAQAHPQIDQIILLAPFTSIADMAYHLSGFRVASSLLSHRYNNVEVMKTLFARSHPPNIHIFHGARDTMVPLAQGRHLAQLSKSIHFHIIESANHHNIFDYCAKDISLLMRPTQKRCLDAKDISLLMRPTQKRCLDAPASIAFYLMALSVILWSITGVISVNVWFTFLLALCNWGLLAVILLLFVLHQWQYEPIKLITLHLQQLPCNFSKS